MSEESAPPLQDGDNDHSAHSQSAKLEGVAGVAVSTAALDGFEWEAALPDEFGSVHRHKAMQRARELAETHQADGNAEKAGVFRLLAAVISMHQTGTSTQPFTAMFQDGTKCSAMPAHLDKQDVQLLGLLAERASGTWLRARIADVGAVAARQHGLPSWEMGRVAAHAYLEEARKWISGHEPIRAVDAVKYMQRALQLSWTYARKDQEFHDRLWLAIEEAFDCAAEKRSLGVLFPLGEEVIARRSDLAARYAEKLEALAEQFKCESDASSLDFASRSFSHAARLWHAAKDERRSRACYHKAGDALIELSRKPGQAMVRAEWMSEGIALLRRHRGDRERIRQLQIELTDVRQSIQEEMHVLTHPFDVKDLVEHVERKLDADTLERALLQLAFAFSQFSSAEEVRSGVLESSRKFAFQHLFSRVTYNADGVPIARSAPLDVNDAQSVEHQMVHNVCEFHHPILGNVAVLRAVNLLRHRFAPSLNEVMQIVGGSPCVPEGHRWSISRGILAGLEHDWHEAAIFLIPQVEPFIRAAFKRANVNTLSVKDHGEEEKSLNELLDHPEVSKVLFPDLVLELKAILCHRAGHNLRNRFGHGLINDEDLASTATIVLWWTMLRLILWPYRHLLLERDAFELASTDAGPSEPD
jgi:hypothetical protein